MVPQAFGNLVQTTQVSGKAGWKYFNTTKAVKRLARRLGAYSNDILMWAVRDRCLFCISTAGRQNTEPTETDPDQVDTWPGSVSVGLVFRRPAVPMQNNIEGASSLPFARQEVGA